MIEQGQVDFVINHPMFYPAALLVFVLVIVLLKFLVESRSIASSRSLEDAPRSSGSGKRKKVKKQKSQEKKAADSIKVKKDTRKNEMDSLIETNKRTSEEGKSDKKKDGKSKTKSKKKKNSQSKVDASTHSETIEANLDGEWQTVSTKEQREQLKREKRKLEESLPVSMETANEKSVPVPLVQPLYKPTPNISAIAKAIAPRFARAAGEQWKEKPAVAPVTSLHAKRPMPPVTVPGTAKPQSQPSKPTTVKQPWVPGSQGKQFWSGDIESTWPNSSAPSSTSNPTSNSDFFTTTLLSMATSVDKTSVPGWPQGGSTWQSRGSPLGNMTRDITTEDWVHVNGQNGRQINNTSESWPGGESPIRTQTTKEKVDEWIFEPEGFPLRAPQLDPNDPWNIEVVETEENGDWSAPASSWENTNAEWTAPVAVKTTPTYFDESSDDERISGKVISHHSNISTIMGLATSVPDSTNQGQSKKSRRRRKKKQNATGEPEQLSTPKLESPKYENLPKNEMEMASKAGSMPLENKKLSVDEVKDEWTIPKVSKKRKNKARKAD